jgi:DNA helicase-2/ATP-dependent DNA helicase PcrA
MPKPESLNPAQWEAVYHHEGPLLILAGAGSGKTRVITYRLAELLRRGVSSQRLLVVTFTNKAAAELRQRVSSLLHEHAADREQSPEMSPEMSPELPRWIGTFHSIGARLLRRLASYAGLPASFPILDEDDTLKVCKELIAEAQIDERLLPPRALRAHIDRAKNQGLLAEEYQGSDYFSDLVRKLYLRYEARLKQLGAADFGDLLLLPVRIAEREPSVRALLATRFDHVLVDEFQDVNTVQYRLLKLLADQHRNLAVVGDDDQAIYGWRGADVRLLLDFERDWPDARIVKLEENYRSSQVILDAAHAVVSRNEDRHEKRLYTQRDGGDPVVFLRTRDDRSEAQFVVGTILRMQAEEGYFPEDFAVIYRTNAQSLRFEETLQAAGLPFSLLGGTRFFERAEIKDVLAICGCVKTPTMSWRCGGSSTCRRGSSGRQRSISSSIGRKRVASRCGR